MKNVSSQGREAQPLAAASKKNFAILRLETGGVRRCREDRDLAFRYFREINAELAPPQKPVNGMNHGDSGTKTRGQEKKLVRLSYVRAI